MRDYLQVLKNKNFALLWAGQGVSNLGTRVNMIALTWLIIELTGRASGVSLLYVLLFLPSAVLGPWCGVLVEKWDKKKVILYTDLARGALSFGMALTLDLTMIYALALGQALFTVLFNPAIQSAIPRIVPEKELVTANALSSLTANTAVLAGPALGGVLIAACGLQSAFVVNGVSFVISALSEAWIDVPRTALEKAKPVCSRSGLAGGFKEGWRYIKATPPVSFVIAFFAIFMLPYGALPVLNVVLVRELLLFDARLYGLALSVQGAGLIGGSLFMGRWGKRYRELAVMLAGAALHGAGYVGLGLAGGFVPVAACFALLGATGSMIEIAYTTYLQRAVEQDYRGRVFSIDMAVGDTAGLLSMSSAGILADTLGTRAVVLGGGLSLSLLGLGALQLPVYRRSVRFMEQKENRPGAGW